MFSRNVSWAVAYSVMPIESNRLWNIRLSVDGEPSARVRKRNWRLKAACFSSRWELGPKYPSKDGTTSHRSWAVSPRLVPLLKNDHMKSAPIQTSIGRSSFPWLQPANSISAGCLKCTLAVSISWFPIGAQIIGTTKASISRADHLLTF